ncbi:TolC family protein [Thermosulfurimonas dismutans]|uniref:Outer membrane protein n=1 Tax=Thermosulfurimonas dismutans TaxID=999894 RepID=A0A179D419_9BACT|nr:TolC family protein [Thermosulfurimonas dismutans]OAQ20805.1 Outer membrane protein [Thermosulfurimonas dismutans]
MGRFLILSALLFLGCPLLVEALTLSEAISRALENNPEILARGHEVAAAEAARQAEWGALLPQVNLLAQASRLSDPQAVTSIKGPNRFPSFSRDIYLFDVNLVLPLYEGGRIRKRVKMAKLETALRESLKYQTALDLIANVRETYLLALYLKALVQAREKTLEALKRVAEEARLRLSVGRIAPLDLMRIETQVKAEEAALAESREALRRAKEALSVLMGEPPRSDFELTGKLEERLIEPEAPDWERVLACRPDIAAQRRAVARAEEAVKLAFRGHFPAVELFSNYGRRAGSGFNDSEEVWEAGVRLKLNFFSGGTLSARVAEARAKWLAEREKLRALELSARKEISTALSHLAETREQIAHFEAARQTAKEAFRVASLKYRTGAGTVTDMLLSQAAWFSAETDYLSALYRHAQALIAYERATAEIARGFLNLSCEENRYVSKP